MSSDSLSTDIAIRCENLSKTYLVYDRLISGLARGFLFPKRTNPHVRRIEALKDVNFEIKKGEVFGFLGPNGAGKSTLLACIAGISPFDTGSVEINGQVEALLKIGVGFHPRFTGRENVVVGMISMGASVEEAVESVDAVLDFAELTDFGDMPFYSYSSGMQARLQFSAASHRTPEILILDEALSAGDGFFNFKASRRIEEICNSGATIILVTHSISLVESLCNRAAILNDGIIEDLGAASDIGAKYRNIVSKHNASKYNVEQNYSGKSQKNDIGTGEISIIDSMIEFPEGGDIAIWNKPMSLIVDIEAHEKIDGPRFRVDIYNAHNGVLATSFGDFCVDPTSEEPHTVSLGELDGCVQIRFDIPALPLGGYTYYWSFALIPGSSRRQLETENDYYVFRQIMGYFQVESFPQSPGMIGRTVFTEMPVIPSAIKIVESDSDKTVE